MMRQLIILISLTALLLCPGTARSETEPDIEKIVDGAYLRDSLNRAIMDDITFSAESYSRKLKGNGEVKEEKKYFKTYYFKDTLFRAEFLEYSKNGEKQSEKDLQKQIEDLEKKGHLRDVTINPLRPFYPDARSDYRFNLLGVESKADYSCYHVTVECLIEDKELYEGDYWLETTNLNLVTAQFHPSKLPGPIKQLDMEMSYAPLDDGYWLPRRFHLFGRGRVMLFIKFNFEVEESYSDHLVNSGLTKDFFQEKSDEK